MKDLKLTLALVAALAAAPLAAQNDAAAPPAGGGDAEAIAALMAVNDHEIKAAALAKSKQVGKDVMDYAQMMDKEHGANQQQTEQLTRSTGLQPAETDKVKAMKTKTAAERDALAAKSGADFEAAYIDAMVKDHAEVLARIDGELLPAATDPAVQAHLKTTREHVAMHLEAARKLDK